MDVDVTELIELEAKKVSAVTNPANGTPFVLIKSAKNDDNNFDVVVKDEDTTGDEMGGEGDPDSDDDTEHDGRPFKGAAPPFKAKKADGDEDFDGDGDEDPEAADKFEEQSGKKLSPKARSAFARNAKRIARKAMSAAGCDEDSKEADDIMAMVTKSLTDELLKALSDSDREAMPAKSFAYVDKDGGKHLPIHDADHVHSAFGRFAQQDFSNSDDPAAAKQAAARKIKEAASSHGINIEDESTVGQAAKGIHQDALNGTAMPEENGRMNTGHTLPWFTESMTGQANEGNQSAVGGLPGIPVSSRLQGGESPYPIPVASKINGGAVLNPGAYVKAKAASQLLDAIERVEAQRDAYVSKGVGDPFVSVRRDLATVQAELEATFEKAARLTLTMEEAVKAEERDIAQGFDAEPVDSTVIKAYRRLRAADEKALREAHGALSNVLAQHDQTAASSDEDDEAPVEKEMIHVDLTPEQLAEVVAKASREAVQEVLKQDARNGGNISEEDIKPTSEHDANDINAISGSSSPKSGVTKEAFDAMSEQLTVMKATLDAISRQPREGGPVLDGQARPELAPAAEGRQGAVTKSEVDGEIEALTKSLAEAKDPQVRADYGERLTRLKLTQLHMTGQLA